MEAVAALMEPRDAALGWLVSGTYDLTDRIFKRVVPVIETHFPHRIKLFAPREHRLVVINFGGGESELRAKSADRPQSLLGEALDFLIVDECASVRDDTWDECLAPRLIDRNGWALMISTPSGRGWFHEQWRLGQKNRDAAYESWQAPTRDNPHIQPELIEAERARLDADTFAEKYEATFLGPPEPCEVCGWPDPNWNGAILILGDDEEPERCTACGHIVDRRGKTLLGVDGEGNPKSAVMRCDPAGLTEQEIRNLQDWNAPRKLG
jgi:hypothetical protein